MLHHQRCLRFLAVCLLWVACAAQAEDVEGSKDHPMFSRMPGYEIANYDPQGFASFDLALEPPKSVEGRYWRIEYGVKEGGTKAGPLQIARNYTNLVVKQGGKKLVEQVNTGGGVTVAQMTSGGKPIWVQVDINNGGEMYALTVLEEGSMEQQVEFSAADLASALKAKGSVTLHNVLFDTGKATLQSSSAAVLAPVRELLLQDRSLKLEIQGHTDNAGAPPANLKLSRDRAAAVKAFLTKDSGIDANRLTTAGLGDTKPVADNATEAGRAQNRRVELVKK